VFELVGNLCWVCVCVVHVQTVADTDSLAQASLPRPDEMCRGLPRDSCASGRPGDQSVIFERADNSPRREGSRLSEIPRCSCSCFGALA